jgi:hypothetical protein
MSILQSLPCDAAISEEGIIERIDHWMNKMWNSGGSPLFPIYKFEDIIGMAFPM